MTNATALNPAQRAAAIAQLRSDTFDVLVIGGGVTGCGAALDAATRGLSVALIEAGDLAQGTSSRCGKTFHGGLRYLEQLNFSLVREAAHERNLMLERLCPHLCNPVRFLFPLAHRGWERAYMTAGLGLYDLLGGGTRRELPRHSQYGKRAALELCPALDPATFVGAVQFSDVIFDDARHTLGVARTAMRHGATVVTRCRAVGTAVDAGRVRSVDVHDAEHGETFAIRARTVISATGAWADLTQALTGAAAQVRVRPAKGVHVVVPYDRFPSRTGVFTRTPDSICSIRPWYGHWLIGTTDTPWQHERDAPLATADDIDYLLGQVNRWVRSPLTRDDVLGVFSGVRPLIEPVGAGDSTAALSRDHAVLPGPENFFTVVGGKYTTYRVMARDAVDAAVGALGRPGVPGSVTQGTPLLGADGFAALWNGRDRLATASGLPLKSLEGLLRRFGSETGDVLDRIADSPELAEPVAGADGHLAAEFAHAADVEGALHLDDLLVRRARVALNTRDRGVAAAAEVAGLVAPALGWDDVRQEEEVAAYRESVAAALRAEGAPDDDAAVVAYAAA